MNVPAAPVDDMTARRTPRRGCGLLVSVRDVAEAEEALAGGATIIDVKEPAHGPLGAADPGVTASIAAVVGWRRPWTLACGELAAGVAIIHEHVRAVVAGAAVPPVAAKAGLAGTAGSDWPGLLAAFATGLPTGVEPVAVAYADWQHAGSPPPDDVIVAARRCGGRLFLMDTFDKRGPPVVPAQAGAVTGWIAEARAAGMRVVLAGGLTVETLAAAAECGPDVIAVRSAACVGGRFGAVSRKLVARLGRLCDPAGGRSPTEPPEAGREIVGSAGAPHPGP
jgi:uncharacterized protein (UPF0264 family)